MRKAKVLNEPLMGAGDAGGETESKETHR